MNKKFTFLIAISLIFLLIFPTTVQTVNAKLLLNQKNSEKNQLCEKSETRFFSTEEKISSFLDELKNKLSLNAGSLAILPATLLTAALLSLMFDIGFFDIMLVGFFSFLFGLATWHIFGPQIVVLSPIIGLEIALETHSILNGFLATIITLIFGLTFPASLPIFSSLVLFSIAIDPGPIWLE